MNRRWNALAGIPVLLLAACGGGSSGGGGPVTSAPPPEPPRTNSTLTNLTVSQTFKTAAVTFDGRVSALTYAPSSASSARSEIGSDVGLSYNAASDSYTINVRQAGVNDSETFGQGQLSAADSTTEIAFYERKSGRVSQHLLLYKPGNPVRSLTYVTYGAWQRIDSEEGSLSIDLSETFFVWGIQTDQDDMPSSGTASYSAIVEGVWTTPLTLNHLGGSVDLTANFAANTVEGEFDIIGQDLQENVHPLDILTGTAEISGNTFAGDIEGMTTGFSGSWGGGFFGPGAQEIGGSFRATDGNEQVVGVFVGK
jgi:hypothetical protein